MIPSPKNKGAFLIGASLLFVGINTLLITHEWYWFSLLPLLLILIFLYFFSLEKVYLLIAVFTPFSVDLAVKELGMNITLPTEPLLLGMLVMLLFKFLHNNPFDKRVWFHPVSVIIILQLVWMLLTSITSEFPLVSFKYLLSRLWFVVPLFFFPLLVFKKEKRIRLFLVLFLIPLAGTVVYTTIQHAALGFSGKAAHWVMSPFYNDHTAYGAVLAMFFPVGIALTLDKHFSRTYRLMLAALTLIVFIGILLSVSRAAWLSVLAAGAFFIILHFRIRFRTLAFGGVILVGLLFTFQDRIIERMEKNTQDSEVTDLSKHAKSMSNISTDASNLERLNRWHAAWRMFNDRPFFGWGPGTYQFVYAPYQHSNDLTIISTNFGDLGNVHSEYFGPFCDSGVIGGLLWLSFVVVIIALTMRLWNSDLSPRTRRYLMAVFLGLSTYLVHGALNNFLDSDKASVPFWGFVAILVAIDLFHTEKRAWKQSAE